MKLSDINLGQKLSLNGIIAEYQGIQKVKIPYFRKVEKRVFKIEGPGECLYYNLTDGSKTLKSEKFKLL